MKIAVVTEDGLTISRHFGRAAYYQVITLENWEIVQRELIPKPAHGSHHPHDHHHDHEHGQEHLSPGASGEAGHGFGLEAHNTHLRMSDPIADCEALLSRGMGSGAYQSLEQRGIRPIVTDIENIDEAALAYANGKIINHLERLH